MLKQRVAVLSRDPSRVLNPYEELSCLFPEGWSGRSNTLPGSRDSLCYDCWNGLPRIRYTFKPLSPNFSLSSRPILIYGGADESLPLTLPFGLRRTFDSLFQPLRLKFSPFWWTGSVHSFPQKGQSLIFSDSVA